MVNIFHTRDFPENLLALQRLASRLPMNHPAFSDVNSDLYNLTAGIGGEEFVDNILKQIHFPIPHIILPNLRIAEKNIPSTQIDILIFTPAYVIILEVKNWSGLITFLQIGQVQQEKGELIRTMDCPTVQADFYRNNIEDWFWKRDTKLPIYRAVIFPYASTRLIDAENRGVYFSKELPRLIRKLNKLPTLLNDNLFARLSQLLIESNKPFTSQSICHDYGIRSEELLRGIFCSKCHSVMNKKNKRFFICSKCADVPKNPFLSVMHDWFTLIDNHVSNHQIQLFSGISDAYSVGYFMNKSPYPKSGMNKGTRYHKNHMEMDNYIKRQNGDVQIK